MENKFERDVHQKLSDLQLSPSPQVWEQVEKRLARKRAGRWRLLFLTPMLIGVATFLILYTWDRPQTVPVKSSGKEVPGIKSQADGHPTAANPPANRAPLPAEAPSGKHPQWETPDDHDPKGQTASKTEQISPSVERQGALPTAGNESQGSIPGSKSPGSMAGNGSVGTNARQKSAPVTVGIGPANSGKNNGRKNSPSENQIPMPAAAELEKPSENKTSRLSEPLLPPFNSNEPVLVRTHPDSQQTKAAIRLPASLAAHPMEGYRPLLDPESFLQKIPVLTPHPITTSPSALLGTGQATTSVNRGWTFGAAITPGIAFLNGGLPAFTGGSPSLDYANNPGRPQVPTPESRGLEQFEKGFSLSIGLEATKPLYKSLSLVTGLDYHTSTIHSNLYHFGGAGNSARNLSYKNRFGYLTLPVIGRVHTRLGQLPLHIDAGIQVSLLLHADALQVKNNAFYHDNSLFERLQPGLRGSISLGIWQPGGFVLFVGPEYRYSLHQPAKTGLFANHYQNFAGLKIHFQKNRTPKATNERPR